jgi:inorganic pyrophosphatase
MRKLQGRIDFQGLPISVENRKGSVRQWYDAHNDEHGETKMKYPYGYVRGTLGTDGDAVDVYVGPNEESTKVFIITQMKAPEFKSVDEQKCMLGFNSAAEAKSAYLHHYNDERFFGSMKQMTIEQFKTKLSTHKGKLIKALNELSASATLADTTFMRTSMTNHDEALRLLRQTTDNVQKSCLGLESAEVEAKQKKEHEEEVEKGLRAQQALGMARAYRLHDFYAGTAQPQPAIGTTRRANEWEPPVVPVRKVETPPDEVSKGALEQFVTCGCGIIHKSTNACPRCRDAHSIKETQTPKWEG